MPQLPLEGMTACCWGNDWRHDPRVVAGSSSASCPFEGREVFGIGGCFFHRPLQQAFMDTLAVRCHMVNSLLILANLAGPPPHAVVSWWDRAWARRERDEHFRKGEQIYSSNFLNYIGLLVWEIELGFKSLKITRKSCSFNIWVLKCFGYILDYLW